MLETPRLHLRDFEARDWEAMFAIEGDPITVRYQGYEARTAEGCRAYIARDLAARTSARSLYDLVVTTHDSDRMIGRVGLDLKAPEQRVGELWFVLSRAQWGQGLMPEAARALVDFGFREKQLLRVFLECDPRNAGAIRLAEKLGMKREGQLREHGFYKGEWCDSLVFGVLAREWNA